MRNYKLIYAESIYCTECKQKMHVSGDMTSEGCCGNESCYCSPPDFSIKLFCNNNQCKLKRKLQIVTSLCDHYRIEDFFSRNLEGLSKALF